MNLFDLTTKVPADFRGCLSVRLDGKKVFEMEQGFRDRANELPNTSETRFATASAGKVFVATAILQLVERGRLTLNSTLGELLPADWKRIDTGITVRQLLCHTSGIPDYFDESVMEEYEELWTDFPNYKIRRNADLLPLFIDKPMTYTPGERFHYNNTGYVVLAMIIEAVTGEEFDRYLEHEIFAPCGMLRTGYYELDRLPSGCASSYIWDAQRREYYSNIYSVDAKGTGAGGAFTTVGDIERFWDALLGEKLISKEALDMMLTVQAHDEYGSYGYGIWLDRYRDKNGEPVCYAPHFEGCDPGVSFVSGYAPISVEDDSRLRLNITIVSNYGDNVWELKDAIEDVISGVTGEGEEHKE